MKAVFINCLFFLRLKENFDHWKNLLFNKREFRETDRVCERHFDRSQILTHWEHIIKGEVHQIEREKPKIRADAIPYLNLPDTEDAAHAQKRPHKEPKKRKQNLSNANHRGKVKSSFICSFLKDDLFSSKLQIHVFVRSIVNRWPEKTKKKLSAV